MHSSRGGEDQVQASDFLEALLAASVRVGNEAWSLRSRYGENQNLKIKSGS